MGEGKTVLTLRKYASGRALVHMVAQCIHWHTKLLVLMGYSRCPPNFHTILLIRHEALRFGRSSVL